MLERTLALANSATLKPRNRLLAALPQEVPCLCRAAEYYVMSTSR